MRISKTTHNALQILIAAARSGDQLIKGADLARMLDLTEQNTSKIVHLLSRGGFIRAVRGPKGGMMLARKPDDIRVGDVVLAMERMNIENPASGSKSEAQLFAGVFDDALEAFVSVLNQHTLADMVRNKRGGPLKGFVAAKAAKKAAPAKKIAVKRARTKAQRAHHYIRTQ